MQRADGVTSVSSEKQLQAMTSLSVLMPAHNEGDHILQNIQETARFLGECGWRYEIVIVDDGSQDGTLGEASRAAAESQQIKVVPLADNQGKGFALRYGFQFATGELVAFLDADLDLHPSQLLELYQIMEQTGADVVIGSKNHPQSQLEYPTYRRIMSQAYYWIVRMLFRLPVHDTQTGIKLFRREALEQALPRLLVKRYAFDLELLVNIHHLGYIIAEGPVTLTFRRKWGRIGWSAVWRTWLDTMAIFYRLYILRYYDRVPSLRG
ncbi:MAG: glycosyltransferase family 2 protein [Chloroflexi bacterium]|nr:glycosyltransferase family 2 protein [Chloroflexota bacterium]